VTPSSVDLYGTHVDVLEKKTVLLGNTDPHVLSSYSLMMYPFANPLLLVVVGVTILGNALHVDW
jgi:hypothetical protein